MKSILITLSVICLIANGCKETSFEGGGGQPFIEEEPNSEDSKGADPSEPNSGPIPEADQVVAGNFGEIDPKQSDPFPIPVATPKGSNISGSNTKGLVPVHKVTTHLPPFRNQFIQPVSKTTKPSDKEASCTPLSFISTPATTHWIADLNTIILNATLRDVIEFGLEGGQPDFEHGKVEVGLHLGIVDKLLDADNKPKPGPNAVKFLHKPENLRYWYRDYQTVNRSFALQLAMKKDPQSKMFVYSNHEFFPLNGKGFNTGIKDQKNFHFTTEMSLDLRYQENQVFRFSGDDDVWVFVNGRLALDIGGVHKEIKDEFKMKEFVSQNFPNIRPGDAMKMHIFHAERQRIASNFSISTNIEFTNAAYTYQPIISGGSGKISFSLLKQPKNMHINKNTGLITWNASKEQILQTPHSITLQVEDAQGSRATQTYQVSLKSLTTSSDSLYAVQSAEKDTQIVKNNISSTECASFGFVSSPIKKYRMNDVNTIILNAKVRDVRNVQVKGGLPDFEQKMEFKVKKGIVARTLDQNNKPRPSEQAYRVLYDAAGLSKWFRDIPNVNITIPVQLTMQRIGESNQFRYSNSNFFPINQKGFNLNQDGNNHYFTTEMVLAFKFQKGQVFKFTGDDDLWVFVNRKLALDIGGVHSSISDQFSMDQFVKQNFPGTKPGNKMVMHVFHAERHTTESNFSINTNIHFMQPPYIYQPKLFGAAYPVKFKLQKSPNGMEIDAQTGLIKWAHHQNKPQPGVYSVIIEAIDSNESKSTQSFNIEVTKISKTVDTLYFDEN